MSTANVKNADLGTYIKGNMGKAPKIAIFVDFHPLNLKTEKNDIAYHVGNFATKTFPKIFVSEKLIFTSL